VPFCFSVARSNHKRRERSKNRSLQIPVSAPAQPRTVVFEAAPISYSQTRVLQLEPGYLQKTLVVAALEDDAAGQSRMAYKMLRTQALQCMVAKGWNTLGVTSPGPDQGKTLTSVNLAVSIAKAQHHTVLLVDLDMRKPSVCHYFDCTPENGIEDHFLHGTPLKKILLNPGIDRLVVLPTKAPITNSAELLASPRMAELVRELKERYPSRLVLFDLPPMLAGDDVLAFSPNLDAILMVIKDGATRKKDLAKAMELLKDANILGTVLNDANEDVASYYYHY